MVDQTTEIFSQDADKPTDDTETQSQTPSENPFGDLLSGITNEDGTQKYADVATALNSLNHSQDHISNIEKDNSELKDKLASSLAAEELLRKSANKQEPAQTPLSQEQLFEAIDKVLDDKGKAELKARNLDIVGKAFSDTYGDKAKSELQALAKANDVGIEFIKSLSETSPIAVLKLAGLSDTLGVTTSKTQSTTTTDSFSTTDGLPEPKSIMGTATTKDMVNAWKIAGERVRNQ